MEGVLPHPMHPLRYVTGKLTFSWKNNIRNLVNFHASSQKPENLHFDWIVLSKAYKDLDEKIQKSFMTLNNDAKFEEKLTLGYKNDIRHLVSFHPTTRKLENFTSMGYKPWPCGFKNDIINWVNFH